MNAVQWISWSLKCTRWTLDRIRTFRGEKQFRTVCVLNKRFPLSKILMNKLILNWFISQFGGKNHANYQIGRAIIWDARNFRRLPMLEGCARSIFRRDARRWASNDSDERSVEWSRFGDFRRCLQFAAVSEEVSCSEIWKIWQLINNRKPFDKIKFRDW